MGISVDHNAVHLSEQHVVESSILASLSESTWECTLRIDASAVDLGRVGRTASNVHILHLDRSMLRCLRALGTAFRVLKVRATLYSML